MLQDVDLQFYPSTTNCLAWNQDDGQLAIAAGEYVHILVPNHHRRNGKTQYGSSGPWVHVHFRVNLFTFEEWPPQEPASLEDLSLGEEQSVSTVSNLSWSAPGLAKHGRSVLMVLTSNLILSLWESVSDPGEASSWQRISVINNVLREYFTMPGISQRATRKRTRIRAAAWADARKLSFRKTYIHILAVTNDHRHVVFLQVRRPYDIRDPCSQKLQVEVLLHLSDLSESRLQNEPTVDFQGILQQVPINADQWQSPTLRRAAGSIQQRIDHDITWSPWEDVDGTKQAMITYRNNGWVRHYLLQYRHEDSGLEKLEHYDEPFSDGPIVWIYSDGNGHAFVCGARDAVELNYYRTASRMIWKDKSLSTRARRSLTSPIDRWGCAAHGNSNSRWCHPWDMVSGLVVLRDDLGAEDLIVLATHLSNIEIFSLNMDLMPITIMNKTAHPSVEDLLRTEMARCRRHFASQHKLTYETTVMKIWGLATYGGIVAACVTMHPSDMVEYIIPSIEQATVLFSNQAFEPTSFDWEKVQEERPSALAYQATWDRVFGWPIAMVPSDDHLGRRIMYNHICASILLYPGNNGEENLSRWNTSLKNWWATSISPALVELERPLPPYMHDNLKLCLTSASESDTPTSTQRLSMLNKWIQQRITAEQVLPQQQRLVEICRIAGCGRPLRWDGILNARCTDGQLNAMGTGHRWRRCALTFLAIQEPGVSKYCEVCSCEYLNEEKLIAEEAPFVQKTASKVSQDIDVNLSLGTDGSVNKSTEPGANNDDGEKAKDTEAKVVEELVESLPLAQMMFNHFDRCIFCDGKFVG